MAEVVSLAASLLTLVSTAFNTCQTAYNTINAIATAPKQIGVISQDIEDIYLTLRALNDHICRDYMQLQTESQLAPRENLVKVLERCLPVLASVNKLINNYKPRGLVVRIWKRVIWAFQEKKIDQARADLNKCKVNLNLAIAVANL